MRICVQVLLVFRFCSDLFWQLQTKKQSWHSNLETVWTWFCFVYSTVRRWSLRSLTEHETVNRTPGSYTEHFEGSVERQTDVTRLLTAPSNREDGEDNTPFIFFCRVEFSACRRRSSPSTGLEVELGGALDGAAAPRSFRPWFSCSSCSICVHSWKNPEQNQD